MKKQMQSIRIFLFASLLITNLVATASEKVMIAGELCPIENQLCFEDVFIYSWTAEPGAVGYVLDLVNTANQDKFSWETTQTTVTSFGVPSGTYALTVTAKFADTSSGIIVEDFIMH